MQHIIQAIDAEITRLKEVKSLLSGVDSVTEATAEAQGIIPARRRKLSPESKRLIAEAMKRRWAERHKQALKASENK